MSANLEREKAGRLRSVDGTERLRQEGILAVTYDDLGRRSRMRAVESHGSSSDGSTEVKVFGKDDEDTGVCAGERATGGVLN
jgi:hypothetical protein